MDAAEELRRALASLRAGRADEAEAILRDLLRAAPAHGGARLMLGIALLEQGRAASALAELEAAARLLPPSPELEYNRGNALSALERLDEAARAYARACALKPGFAEAHFNAGNVARARSRPAAALAEYRAAAAANPKLARAHWRMGQLLTQSGQDAEAEAALLRALELEPGLAPARLDLGVARHRQGRVEAALEDYEAVLARDERDADAWNNRGNAMHDLRRMPEALACYERALALRPDWPEAVCNRGLALQELRRFDEAEAAYDEALRLRPAYHEALKRRAGMRLLLGRFAPGWADFEAARAAVSPERGSGPRWWRAEPLAGRAIVVVEPNGIGDALQFLRFVPRLFELGAARVAFAMPARFHRLLRSADPRIEWRSDQDSDAGFDFRCMAWSLPHWLGVGDAVSAPTPYLQAEPERVMRWRARLDPQRLNVGICWQGNPARKIDRGRSVPLAEFAPLARVPGVRLLALQKHFGLEQLQALPAGMQVDSPGADFDEGPDAFVDTAALVQALDLVVCPDTSLTHLAGALARPAWLALNPVPDWRWQLQREDSPWYPGVRLFRQDPQGGWAPVFARMAEALAAAAPALRAGRPG